MAQTIADKPSTNGYVSDAAERTRDLLALQFRPEQLAKILPILARQLLGRLELGGQAVDAAVRVVSGDLVEAAVDDGSDAGNRD